MAKRANENLRFSMTGLTAHELDVLWAYRSKLETHKGVDVLLGIEEEENSKQVSASIVGLGYDINRTEDCYDELCKMQRRIEKWNPEIGEYTQKRITKMGKIMVCLRGSYNRLYEEQ